MSIAKSQHWLIDILRELKDKDVLLDALVMMYRTYELLTNFVQHKELDSDPLDKPCFHGLQIIINLEYEVREIFFKQPSPYLSNLGQAAGGKQAVRIGPL